jgi:hypothetical protein
MTLDYSLMLLFAIIWDDLTDSRVDTQKSKEKIKV